MQKIKSVLSGNNTEPSAGDRTSREYTNPPSDSLRSGDQIGSSGSAGGLSRSGVADTTTSGGSHIRDSIGSTGTTGQVASANAPSYGHAGNAQGETNAAGYDTSRSAGTTGTSGLTGHSGTTGVTGATGTTGTGRSEGGLLNRLTDKHDHGHDSVLASKFDPAAESTHHDHKHLHHVTHRDVRHQEVEEVSREKTHERHVHHVQHHVQPIHHQEINPEVHHEKAHPVTKISEQHVNSESDRQLFQGLGEKHRDQETHRPKERTVVDLGEKVNEVVQHHVHHVTQPVVKTEVQDRHRIHTVIPVHQTTHEAPIIHKSSMHEPISMADFKKGGGVLGSGIGMKDAGVLQSGECTRSVDGVGEKLAQELHLGSSTRSAGTTTGTTGATST